MDITEFVRARLDEDEALAKATGNAMARSEWESDGRHVFAPGKPKYPGRPELPLTGELDAEMADHIARHDPARVLREVAAKQAILAAYAPVADLDGLDEPEYAYGRANGLGEAVRQLAAVWSDHPDYRAEWKPEP